MAIPVQKASESILSRMRFPQLFLLLAALFVADFFFPDPLPFVDEFILGVLTVMAGMWKKDRSAGESKPPEKNVTPNG